MWRRKLRSDRTLEQGRNRGRMIRNTKKVDENKAVSATGGN
jgi:hypothetical protein